MIFLHFQLKKENTEASHERFNTEWRNDIQNSFSLTTSQWYLMKLQFTLVPKRILISYIWACHICPLHHITLVLSFKRRAEKETLPTVSFTLRLMVPAKAKDMELKFLLCSDGQKMVLTSMKLKQLQHPYQFILLPSLSITQSELWSLNRKMSMLNTFFLIIDNKCSFFPYSTNPRQFVQLPPMPIE